MTATWVACDRRRARLALARRACRADERGAFAREVRNTVINLLEALVQKGVMTREQAEAMVAPAQDKATADAKARAAQDAAERTRCA